MRKRVFRDRVRSNGEVFRLCATERRQSSPIVAELDVVTPHQRLITRRQQGHDVLGQEWLNLPPAQMPSVPNRAGISPRSNLLLVRHQTRSRLYRSSPGFPPMIRLLITPCWVFTTMPCCAARLNPQRMANCRSIVQLSPSGCRSTLFSSLYFAKKVLVVFRLGP